jgi:rRNA maturation endonuclease Nob1
MLVCTGCNIEYEEDKKYCKYCGDPLVPKTEPISTQKKVNKPEEEGSDGQLICPHCKLIYEFGSSCIQCGSPLARQSHPQAKEEPKVTHPPQVEGKPYKEEMPQPQQTETSPKNLVCPACKMTYENGKFCIKCGAALVTQISIELKQEPEIALNPEEEAKSLQIQTLQEQLIQTPRKNLICPDCRIIYERGDTCIRCGSALVTEIPPKEEEKSKYPELPEVNSSTPQPEEESSLRVDSERPSFSAKTQTLEQQPAKKSTDDLERRLTLPKKPKKDYRRLFLEVGSITIMVVAGGYFLWSIYSHLIKRPEPTTPISKEGATQVLPRSSSSTNPTASITGSEESQNTAPASPFPLTPSESSSAEVREIENIKTLLENIRQANLQKNIDLFISCYTADFKDREGKKKATLTYWKSFDYLNLSYDLKNPSISVDSAKARVEWLIKISPKTGGQAQESKTLLDVILKKEEGGWKIKEVKQTG